MIKAELRKLRRLNATKEMMRKAEEDAGCEDRWGHHEKYAHEMFIRAQHLGGFLKAAVFCCGWLKQGIRSPCYEVFINISGEEYITRVLDEDGKETRWSAARIDNLPSPEGRRYFTGTPWMDNSQALALGKSLKTDGKGYDAIWKFQQRICKEKIKEKEKRETAPWDADMALVPELPKAFDRWWRKEGITQNYIFYHYDRKILTGYCSYCEMDVYLKEKPAHNKRGICPKCQRRIQYKADGKISRLTTDIETVQIIQKTKTGFVVRSFEAARHYNEWRYSDARIDNPGFYFREQYRTLYEAGKRKAYAYMLYKNKEWRWVPWNYGYGGGKGLVYPYNIPHLAKSGLKASGIPAAIKAGEKINADRWVKTEMGNPAIEKCVKINAIKLANDLVESTYQRELLEQGATELTKMLKLDKARLKRLVAQNGGVNFLRWLQYEKKMDTVYPDEMLLCFSQNHISAGDLRFINSKMTLTKIYNYLKKQQALCMPGESISQVLTAWRDYTNLAEKAGMRMELEQIYRPKNLKDAHSMAEDILRAEGIKQKAKGIKRKFPKVDKVCAGLKKYEYSDSKYSILAPSGIEDIIREGMALRHCIHTCDFYFDRIQEKESYLFFLRKNSAVKAPWYTLEVEPSGNIRQKRTTGDNQNADLNAALPFLKKWQKHIQKVMGEDDKKLAEMSEKKRKEGYAQIRKDKKQVWHGKLAGKLLADVLEADFIGIEDITT